MFVEVVFFAVFFDRLAEHSDARLFRLYGFIEFVERLAQGLSRDVALSAEYGAVGFSHLALVARVLFLLVHNHTVVVVVVVVVIHVVVIHVVVHVVVVVLVLQLY